MQHAGWHDTPRVYDTFPVATSRFWMAVVFNTYCDVPEGVYEKLVCAKIGTLIAARIIRPDILGSMVLMTHVTLVCVCNFSLWPLRQSHTR